MKRNKPKSSKKADNQLRIIGGQWRSRRLAFPDLPGLRPTPDRVRETLFNWLAPWLTSARCLDIYSGSGALGLEALSRGAANVCFVERAPQAVKHLEKNLSTLECDASQFELVFADALTWLGNQTSTSPFQLVFMDPPFGQGLLESSCELLQSQNLVSTGSLIYLESEQGLDTTLPESWELFRQKSAGQVSYSLYKVL